MLSQKEFLVCCCFLFGDKVSNDIILQPQDIVVAAGSSGYAVDRKPGFSFQPLNGHGNKLLSGSALAGYGYVRRVRVLSAQVGPAEAQVGRRVGRAEAQVGRAEAQVGRGNGCMCDKMPKVHEFPLKFGIAEPKCLICTIMFTYNGKSPRKAAISAQNRPFYRKNRAKQRFLPTQVRNIDEIVQSSDFGSQSSGPPAGGRRSQRWVGISPAEPHAGGRRSQRLDGCRSG